MNPLTLTLRQPLADQPSQEQPTAGTEAGRSQVRRVDLRGIVPDRLAELSLDQIAELSITCQARLVRLGELFAIEDGSRETLLLKGDLSSADNVGGGMRTGRLIVEGPVGNAVGADMRGGHLIVHGDAGDYVATGMRGGYVEIAGSANDYCAGARPGTRRGMRGGLLRVSGSVGRFLGYRMRRGTVVVGGKVDRGCANSMIAGTIVCLDQLTGPIGIGMHRGTLISLSTSAPELHSGFTQPEPIRLSYLYLLFDALRPQLPGVDVERLAKQPMWRALGDRASGGIGELLWLVAEPPAEAMI